MILELFFYSISLSVMSIMSIEDMRTLKIDTKQIILLWCVTTVYAIVTFKGIISLLPLLYLLLVFTFLLLFGFGFGDYLVILSLWSFFGSVNEVFLFVVILFSLWFVMIIIFYIRECNIVIRQPFLKQKLPLLPIITVSFLVCAVAFFIAEW